MLPGKREPKRQSSDVIQLSQCFFSLNGPLERRGCCATLGARVVIYLQTKKMKGRLPDSGRVIPSVREKAKRSNEVPSSKGQNDAGVAMMRWIRTIERADVTTSSQSLAFPSTLVPWLTSQMTTSDEKDGSEAIVINSTNRTHTHTHTRSRSYGAKINLLQLYPSLKRKEANKKKRSSRSLLMKLIRLFRTRFS